MWKKELIPMRSNPVLPVVASVTARPNLTGVHHASIFFTPVQSVLCCTRTSGTARQNVFLRDRAKPLREKMRHQFFTGSFHALFVFVHF